MPDQPLTIEAAAAALRDGSTTSVALTEQCIKLADRFDPDMGTYLARFDETALDAAAKADADLAAGIDRGPLQGIPLGIKDIIATDEGPPTTRSPSRSPATRGTWPARRRARARGPASPWPPAWCSAGSAPTPAAPCEAPRR